MGLIRNIQEFFFRRSLEKTLSENRRDRKSCSLEAAARIGLLFDASDPQTRQTVVSLAKQLKSEGKKVRLLGYLSEAPKDANFPFRQFNKKDLDWALRPRKSEDVAAFLEKEFDLLINLSADPYLPLEYIMAHAKAGFRVGNHEGLPECYDLLLETKRKHDLPHFFGQVRFYLKNMSPQYEQAGT